MPTVPYKPVPDVKATDSGPGGVSVSTPIAAFGGDVATAIGSLGKQVDHAADEIWKRALAMQAVVNEADARAATTDYMETAGQLHAEFNSRQGRDAVTAYPKYIQDLKETRKTLGQGLGNDAARKMYDAQSMPTMSRSIFNGAGHAATENKRYAAGTAQAQIEATNNYILHNPEDDNAFRHGITQAASIIRNVQAPLAGWGPEQTNEAINKERSKMVASRIIGMSRTQPIRAKEMFEQHREDLYGPDLERVDKHVTSQLRTTGARVISSEVNPIPVEGEKEEPLQSRIDRGVKKAEAIAPEDAVFKDFVTQQITADFNRRKAVIRDFELSNRNTVEGALAGGIGGKIPTTVDELRALDPKVDAAWGNLSEIYQRSYMKALATNAKGDIAWGPDSLRRYQELKGMASADPVGFMGIDVINEKMPNRARLELINLQQKKKDSVEGDPRIVRAVQQLRPMLTSAKITVTDDKEAYYRYVGSLQDALEEWQAQHKKQPNYKELQEIGARLLQDQLDPEKISIFGLIPRKTPLFQMTVPNEVAEAIRADPMWEKMGITPTDEQIRRVYVRKRYQELYGGQATKPEVPK